MMQQPDFAELTERRRRASANRVLLMALFARIDTVALASAVGTVVGLGLFLATAVLLLKGSPPNVPVGPNLSALGTFLPGYSVTWIGGVIGAIYGFLVGAAIGFVMAALWNFTHLVFIGFAAIKGNWMVD